MNNKNKIITISMNKDVYDSLENMRGLIPRSVFLVELIKTEFNRRNVR